MAYWITDGRVTRDYVYSYDGEEKIRFDVKRYEGPFRHYGDVEEFIKCNPDGDYVVMEF